MLSASYTLTLKDQRIFICNTEFTWKTKLEGRCDCDSLRNHCLKFFLFFPLFYCSHAEIQKKHEQLSRKEQEKVLFAEKLTSLISEELQKGMAAISSKTFSFVVCICGLFGSLEGFSALCYIGLHCFDWLLLRVFQLPGFYLHSDGKFSRAFRRLRLLSVLIGSLVQFCFPALFADCLYSFLFKWVLLAPSVFPPFLFFFCIHFLPFFF